MERLIALPQETKDKLVEYSNEYLDLMYCTGLCHFALEAAVYSDSNRRFVNTEHIINSLEDIAENQSIVVVRRDGYWISDDNFDLLAKTLDCVPVYNKVGRIAYYNYWYFVSTDGRSLRHEEHLPKELLPEIEKYSEIRRNIVKQFVKELTNE